MYILQFNQMKNVSLILIFSLVSSFVTFAQNYQTVISSRISYFDDQYRNIKCIRTDSVKFQTDSTLYPFSNIQQTEDGCFTPFGDSWIGKKIIKKENGLNIFFNRDHDSIKLNTTALLNDRWTAYYLPDSIKIIATVINHDTMSFLGQLDSVKTIGFQVYDKNMDLLDYPLNNMELRISKNFGLVKTINFYLFPNLTENYDSDILEEFSLIGLSNPKIGIQNLTWFEINDFQPGDELHIVSESNSWGGYHTSDKIIRKYLGRSDYSDSIVYTYSQKESYYFIYPDTSYLNVTNSTKKEVIRSDPGMDKLPGEPVFDEDSSNIFYYRMINSPVLSKIYPNGEIFYRVHDLCWDMIIYTDDCLLEFEYLKGLGGPYCECSGFLGNKVTKLVYYKKGDVSRGTPLVITSLPDRPDKGNILVFPNPAHDLLTIRINNYDHRDIFEILDITGRIIVKKNIISKESTIGIEDLKPGTYLYRIRNDKEIAKMDKLIIK
jgi:hypothetical protein